MYEKIIKDWEDLWDEYCRLLREVKELVREKKLTIWNEVVEKVDVNYMPRKGVKLEIANFRFILLLLFWFNSCISLTAALTNMKLGGEM